MVVEELGPKYTTLQKFKEEYFLASMDLFLEDCQKAGVPVEALNKINALTLHYSAACSKQKPNRALVKFKKWLRDNDYLAVPYDKGCGFCIMKRSTYNEKIHDILKGDQFEVVVPRKKDLVVAEEARVCATLLEMKKSNQIPDWFYQMVRPAGSQPTRLYGLAKVNKLNVPLILLLL